MTNHRPQVWARELAMLSVASMLGLALLSAPARASLLTISDTASGLGGNFFPITLALDRFNTSLGRLTKVEVAFDASASFRYPDAACTLPAGCHFFAPYITDLRLDDLVMGEIAFQGLADNSRGTLSCHAQQGQTCIFSRPDPAVLIGRDSSFDPATLALFAGPGTFALTFTSSGLSGLRTDAKATVTYTYDDSPIVQAQVPEPGTLAATGIALLVLLGTTRARRRIR